MDFFDFIVEREIAMPHFVPSGQRIFGEARVTNFSGKAATIAVEGVNCFSTGIVLGITL